MIKVVSVDAVRKIEASADKSVMRYAQMMENAGKAGAVVAKQMIADLDNPRVTILIGGGNNGGDGLVTARYLAQETDAEVRLYLLKRRDESDDNYQAVMKLGMFIAYAEDDRDKRVLRNMVASADLVIDALFGIGVRLPIKGEAEKILRHANQAIHERQAYQPEHRLITPSKIDKNIPRLPRVLAIDCPSGLDCDTGEIDRNAIKADKTITFIAGKTGLFEFEGAKYVGELIVAPIGIPSDLLELAREKVLLVDSMMVRGLLPPRAINSHKGTYGKVLIIGGSRNYSGAPALSAESAYRSGVGLITLAISEAIMPSVASKLTEPIYFPLPDDLTTLSKSLEVDILQAIKNQTAMLIGVGWGQTDGRAEFFDFLLEHKNEFPPFVVDADGLNLLAKMDNWWERLPEQTVITPHMGELSRLSGLSIAEIRANRLQIAGEKAREWNVTLVMKGVHTIVAHPDGRTAILPFKTDALATAGTGDILAGLVAGFLAQGMDTFNSAVCAGYVHGMAGEMCQTEYGSGRGVIASDVLAMIPYVSGELEA